MNYKISRQLIIVSIQVDKSNIEYYHQVMRELYNNSFLTCRKFYEMDIAPFGFRVSISKLYKKLHQLIIQHLIFNRRELVKVTFF